MSSGIDTLVCPGLRLRAWQRETGHGKGRGAEIIIRATEAYQLVLASKWKAGWNMMAQINCKPTYSTWSTPNICVITHQDCCNTGISHQIVSSAHLWLGSKNNQVYHYPESKNCWWAGSSRWRKLCAWHWWLLLKLREHCVVLSSSVCAEKAFLVYWPLYRGQELHWLNWINVIRRSLCFKDSLSWVSGWHDEVVDCHSCLAKPAKSVWLNFHSFPKETWSQFETYKPYGQVTKMSLQ